MINGFRSLKILVIIILLLLAACGRGPEEGSSPATAVTTTSSVSKATLEPTYAAMIAARRSPDVPELPFPDNPDPSQCGIPVEWGEGGRAWLNGRYRGDLIQPTVFLYDSHLRLEVVARAPHGSEVTVVLYQQNPVTDYYLVKIKGAEPPNEGWVPGPLLEFEPVPPAG
jgi:hypothetical protein